MDLALSPDMGAVDIPAPASLLPANPSFAGHQTFAMRSGWLKKGIDGLYDAEAGGGTLFTRDDALVTLGVGKNMVQSMRHWLLVTRMAEEHAGPNGRVMQPTPLGKAIFGTPDTYGWDPFLEDDATLWLLHWQLAGPGSLAFSWVWTFNLFREYEFTKETLTDAIASGAAARVSKPPSRETIGRDLECLLHTYVVSESSTASEDRLDCPLNSLHLIRPSYERHYRFQIGPKSTLEPAIFYYALARFWQWKQSSSRTLSLWDITYAEGSPGAVFKLDEDSVLEYLDGLAVGTEGLWRFEDTALIRQVVREEETTLDLIRLLKRHYDG